MAFFSTTLTGKTTKQMLLTNKPHIKRVSQISVIVRSMGTATYYGIGGFDTQDRRLTTVGDSISIDTPKNRDNIDVSTLFMVSDTADPVVEIIGETLDTA